MKINQLIDLLQKAAAATGDDAEVFYPDEEGSDGYHISEIVISIAAKKVVIQ